MDYKSYLIPYTTIISSIEDAPALEGTLNICELARSLAEKFLTWLIGKIQMILTKLGILKKTVPASAENEVAAKQIPHIDKTFKILQEAMGFIESGYMQFRFTPIRTSKMTALNHSAAMIDQKVNAARGEVEIVYSIGNGAVYLANGSFDDWIQISRRWLDKAKDCKDKVLAYYDKLTRSDPDFKTASTADINAFNQSITNYVSFVTGFTQMIMTVQGG
ncbi:MAG: hypothetical protein NC548_05350 [Lachnospiraceae bacterium]|nr:hypothetical protein [Lachnospiraceae bacterium]